MLAEFVTANLFAFFTVFARLGAALMLMPPFGDTFIPPRIRLSLALAISALVTPLAAPTLPALPEGPIELAVILIGEIAVGLFIGGLTRILMSGLHTASIVIAYQTGLGAATAFAPDQGSDQGVMFGRLLTLVALVLLFETNLHQMLLLTLIDSYRALPPGGLPPAGDFATMAVDFMAGAFVIAVKVAAPLLVIGFLFYVGIGLLSRLMPAMQVFFVALPLQMALGFWVLMVGLSTMMLWYLEFFEERVAGMFPGG